MKKLPVLAQAIFQGEKGLIICGAQGSGKSKMAFEISKAFDNPVYIRYFGKYSNFLTPDTDLVIIDDLIAGASMLDKLIKDRINYVQDKDNLVGITPHVIITTQASARHFFSSEGIRHYHTGYTQDSNFIAMTDKEKLRAGNTFLLFGKIRMVAVFNQKINLLPTLCLKSKKSTPESIAYISKVEDECFTILYDVGENLEIQTEYIYFRNIIFLDEK